MATTPTYRQWLQSLASNTSYGLPQQESSALIQVVGDDGIVNHAFEADPYKYTGNANGHIVVKEVGTGADYGYGPQGANALNDKYYAKYNQLYGNVKGASNTTGGASAADLAYLDDQEGQLRQMLSSSDNSLGQGITQLDDSFNKGKQANDQGRVDAKANFATKREDTTKDMLGERNSVNTNARTLSDSVRRMLGMSAGANSSAYQYAAPAAIARDTSKKTGAVSDAFARNNRNVDNAEADTLHQFDLSDEDLGVQRKQKESDLRGGILQQQQGVYADLADIARQRAAAGGAGYAGIRAASAGAQGEIASRQSALDNLFSQFRTPFTPKAVTPTEANLDKYNQDKTNLATNNGGGDAASGDVSPFLTALRKRFQTAQ